MRLLLISLLLSFLFTNCPTEGGTDMVNMNASVNPEEAGTVNPPQGTYITGKQITVVTEASDDRWQFTGWSGDTTASADSLTFNITSDMELIANYEIPSDEQPILMTSTNPGEAGTVNPEGGTFELGASVDVEALPNMGWNFVEWSGDTSATANPLNLTMNKDYNLVANFEKEVYSLATTVNPSSGGSVEPSGGDYEFGVSVDVEAIAASGWKFTNWSGDTTVSTNPLTVTFDKDYSLTANFKELSKSFTNRITVTDGANSKDVIFGMKSGATAGFDSNIDVELPPRPPKGNFYRRFNIPDYGLKEDFRAIREQQTIWELEVAPETGRTITLNWDFSNTNHVGSLTLTDNPDNPSFEIDMKSQTSYNLSSESPQILYIISQN